MNKSSWKLSRHLVDLSIMWLRMVEEYSRWVMDGWYIVHVLSILPIQMTTLYQGWWQCLRREQSVLLDPLSTLCLEFYPQLPKNYSSLYNSFTMPSKITLFVSFYPRDAMLARVFAIATCLDVCLSVRLSHAGIVPSRAKAGSWNVYHLIAPSL